MMRDPSNETYHEQTAYGGMQPDGDDGAQQKDGATAASKYQTPEHQKDYRMIKDWWLQARTAQAPGRYEQALDDDFYDGLQWNDEDAFVVESRGQAALTFNQVKPVCDWIIGTQKRAKYDWHVFPRTDDDRDGANVKTKALKFTDDVNHAKYHRSRAFSDAVRVGVGWVEDGIKRDPTDEPLYSRCESWRNVWYDHTATEPDLSDARYLFRSRWVDTDIAQAYFPGNDGAIKSAAEAHDLFGGTDDDDTFVSQLYYGADSQGYRLGHLGYGFGRRGSIEDIQQSVQNRRSRVRLVECWYRKPVPRKIMRVHDVRDPNYSRVNGETYRAVGADPKADALIADGIASTYDAIKLEMWLAIFIDGTLLQNAPSEYKHDSFSLTPVWAYRRKRDGAAYGVIRNMRDPQEDMNKRRSKALHILSTAQVVAEEDAVADVEEAREEVASPEGWVTVRKNKRFDILRDTALAREHLQMEQMDRAYIRESGGINSENLGHETNATSGVAIEARQAEGAVATTELFDNLHFASLLQGEKRLSLLEQYYSAAKMLRITDDTGGVEFAVINDVTGVDENGEPIVENDITASKADFVIDEVDFRTSVRQAMFDQMFAMMGEMMKLGERGGEAAWNMLDLVVEMSDIPNKDVFVARIRKLNGQPDPALEGSPEAEQELAMKQAQEAEAAAIQKRAIEAEVSEKEASAMLKKQQAIGAAVAAIREAADAGEKITLAPEIAMMLDEILQFVDESMVSQQPAQPPMPAAPQQVAA